MHTWLCAQLHVIHERNLIFFIGHVQNIGIPKQIRVGINSDISVILLRYEVEAPSEFIWYVKQQKQYGYLVLKLLANNNKQHIKEIVHKPDKSVYFLRMERCRLSF